MSIDITANKTLKDSVYGIHADGILAMLTLSGRLNDYWKTHELLTSNYVEILTRQDGEKIYVISKELIIFLIKESKRLNLGEDVDNFLTSCLKSGCGLLYFTVNG